jgi:hypothetical protein
MHPCPYVRWHGLRKRSHGQPLPERADLQRGSLQSDGCARRHQLWDGRRERVRRAPHVRGGAVRDPQREGWHRVWSGGRRLPHDASMRGRRLPADGRPTRRHERERVGPESPLL